MPLKNKKNCFKKKIVLFIDTQKYSLQNWINPIQYGGGGKKSCLHLIAMIPYKLTYWQTYRWSVNSSFNLVPYVPQFNIRRLLRSEMSHFQIKNSTNSSSIPKFSFGSSLFISVSSLFMRALLFGKKNLIPGCCCYFYTKEGKVIYSNDFKVACKLKQLLKWFLVVDFYRWKPSCFSFKLLSLITK